MKKNNLKDKFAFLLENGEKTIYTQRFADFGKYKRIVFFICGILLVLSDCFFLGASIVLAFFDSLKWYLIALFVLKVFVDVVVLGLWLYSINETSKRNENTYFLKTDKKFAIVGDRDGELFFKTFPLDCEVVEKPFLSYRKITLKADKKEHTFYLKATNQKIFEDKTTDKDQ